ncbi:MAG TPA: dihydroorotate dehydrogenase [Clostridiales bacterium]|nr:dihydroorotate dehydrogenase [Clostridiales bacterium]
MKNIKTKLGQAEFRNPVLGASGCTGYAYELESYTDLSRYGAVTLKTVTYTPRHGNHPERIAEVPAGIISSIGLQNPGPDVFFDDTMPKVIDALDRDQIIVSVAGDTIEEYVELCCRTSQRYGEKIAALEINAACPNVRFGVGYFSRDPQAAFDLIETVKSAVSLPVFFKFNTNFENYLEVASAIDEAGVDALYTSNTPLGLKINIRTRRPAIGNVVGPICGPAIRPIGMLRVWNLYQKVKMPIIASGGVYTWEDALEYMLAGAAAVGVGSAQFVQPDVVKHIVDGLERYMERESLDSLTSLVGAAHR